MKTLIGNDDDITRLLLSPALTRLGHDMRGATNGREAWDAWLTGNSLSTTLDKAELLARIASKEVASVANRSHVGLFSTPLP